MKSLKLSWILICSLICIFMFGCKPEEIILHGEITGIVTESETNQPLNEAAVIISQSNDTTITESDGTYLLKNLAAGNYEIQALKTSYEKETRGIVVTSANTERIDFSLKGIPWPKISEKYLDFGLDLVVKSFTVSNTGVGKMDYFITASKDWINFSSSSGDVTNETDTITVAIDKSSLSEDKHKEIIKIYSIAGSNIIVDTVNILMNGVLDEDNNYYKVIKIGTQTWMAENLNVGRQSTHIYSHTDNEVIEKYCYDDNKLNCDIYGGLYEWREMMQYSPSDAGIIGTTQGICPVGWHLPTNTEWLTLINYLGGSLTAGRKLKESGTTHWISPNIATNESGFTGLPGGIINKSNLTICGCQNLCEAGLWWSSSSFSMGLSYGSDMTIMYETNYPTEVESSAYSVRCIKDPLRNK